MQLNKKIAIVTGSSSGLGAAIAASLVNKGVEVFGLARNATALNELKNNLGNHFYPVQMDISKQDAVTTWVKNIFSENYSPDILINNAGIGSFGKIDEMPSEDWMSMINTNLNGIYFMTSRVVSLMKMKKGSTHIINIGSIMGTIGQPERVAYCTTKFGIRGFSEALFKELRYEGIKVTCLNPGSVETDFFKNSGIKAHHNMLHAKDVANTIIHILETPDNMLIDELTMRPLNPKDPGIIEKQ